MCLISYALCLSEGFLFNRDDIIEVGGVLPADVFTFEVPRLVCSALNSYPYDIVAILAVDAPQRKKQQEEELDQPRKRSWGFGMGM